MAEISAEFEAILDGLSEEDKEHDSIKDGGDGFINAAVVKEAKQLKAEVKKNGAFAEDSMEASLLKVDRLIFEERALKKALKTDSQALHLKTKATIEALSDAQVNKLLEHKWITPLLTELKQLPTAIMNELTQKLQQLADKYATTYADVERGIKTTEQSLATMLDELTGNEFDQQGLAELKTLLQGGLNE